MTGPRFLEAAAALGARLCRDAIWHGERCNWTGDAQEGGPGGWTVMHRAMGPSLYDGTAGIGLFLAHLHAATDERPFRTAARGALRQAVSRAGRLEPPFRAALHGGDTGIAWALERAAAALGEEEWRAAADALAAGLEGSAPDPRALDVIGGSAGAVPAWLHLAARLQRPALAEAAARHGDGLLACARPGPAGWSWRTLETPCSADLTGYSHGAAGIALALLELWRATGEERFRHGAEEGFRYEAACWSPERGNWPDFRMGPDPSAAPSWGMSWCHGAPGIALSRARAWTLTGDPARLAEAGAALATTAAAVRAGGMGFSLCHGDAGNADVLLLASGATGDPALPALAEEVGRAGIARHLDPRVPWPCGVPGGGETPGLLLGLAGIGHFYLRLHDPAVPSPLLVAPE